MTERILIVEDEFIVAHDLQLILTNAGYHVAATVDSVKNALVVIENEKVDLVLLDIFLKGKQTGIDLAKILMKKEIAFIFVSANSNEKVLEAAKSTLPYGFIVKPYRESDVLLSIDIARYRKAHSEHLKISSKLFIEDFVVDISMKPISGKKKLLLIAGAFQPYIPFDFIAIIGRGKGNVRYAEIGVYRKKFNEYDIVSPDDFIVSSGVTSEHISSIAMVNEELTSDAIYIGAEYDQMLGQIPIKKLISDTYALRSNLIKSVLLDNGDRITFSFYSKLENIFRQEHLDLLNILDPTLAKNLGHILEMERAFSPKSAGAATDKTPPASPLTHAKFNNIAGQSPALLNLLDKILIVAPTDTSVLITGESGTGKEMIAQSLHQLSSRNTKPMIAVNCAALPADLIESILFGHEKGAFTGATGQRIGKFEEASGGTIFLDEIGEMPVELQAKLLRVLQEKEIERIGGSAPVSVDLRIIAATNLDLAKEIAKGRFRLDLFFRLNVFPLEVPSLRSRKDDIPSLVLHFLNKHSQALGKTITGTTTKFIDALLHYHWPGNIRELEHVILRSMLLSKSTELHEDVLDLDVPEQEADSPSEIKTIMENERDHIINVLNKCKGRISGTKGAAYLLGIPATTLNSKIKKLKIKR